MMEYTVVFAPTIDGLFQKVNSRIGEGWRPIGGMGMTQNNYYQTMIRES